MKHVQDLYTENCKTLLREIKEDINKLRSVPYSWFEWLSF